MAVTGTLLMQSGTDDPDAPRHWFKIGWTDVGDKPIVVLAYVGDETFAADAATFDDAVMFLASHGLELPEAARQLIGG